MSLLRNFAKNKLTRQSNDFIFSTDTTFADTFSASSSIIHYAAIFIPSTTIKSDNKNIIDNAASVFITDAPVNGTNITATNYYPLYVASGLSEFNNGLDAEQPLMIRTSNTTNTIGVGTDTALTYWGDELNKSGPNYISYASGQITVSLTGKYYIMASVDFTGDATSGQGANTELRQISIYKNGTKIAEEAQIPNTSANILLISSVDVATAANTIYDIRVWHFANTNITFPNSTDRNKFIVAKLS